jgi:mRNA interferase MazF
MKQGDIIKLSLDPTKGHEQAGYRPAIVVSNEIYHQRTNLVIICPITNTVNNFPMHVRLGSEMKTSGVIKCKQIKAVDPQSRPYIFIETAPEHILQEVVDIIFGSMELARF